MDEMVDLLVFFHRPVRPPASVSSPMPTTSLPSTVRPHLRRAASPQSDPVSERSLPLTSLSDPVSRRLSPLTSFASPEKRRRTSY